MDLTITKKIGKRTYHFRATGQNLYDVVTVSQKLSFGDIKQCGLCGNDNLYLTAYETKEDHYKYVKVACANCKASLTFGQKRADPDTFYYRRREDGKLDWQAYKDNKPKATESIARAGEETPFN